MLWALTGFQYAFIGFYAIFLYDIALTLEYEVGGVFFSSCLL